MSTVRGPFPRRKSAAPTASAPCELPPAEVGRLSSPPHPILGILFVLSVALAVLWGAGSRSGSLLPRLTLAYGALCVLLMLAVHLLEEVEFRHVPGKLGLVAQGRLWWGVALLASLPAAVALAVRPQTRQFLNGSVSSTAMSCGILLLAAAWQEGFFRGYVFRSLMRRHSFLFSASVTSLLFVVAMALQGQVGVLPTGWWRALLYELPLSFGLCSMFWLSGPSLLGAVAIRMLLLSSWWLAGVTWPMASAAVVLLILSRLIVSRSTYTNAAATLAG